jgi:hypothetical protein
MISLRSSTDPITTRNRTRQNTNFYAFGQGLSLINGGYILKLPLELESFNAKVNLQLLDSPILHRELICIAFWFYPLAYSCPSLVIPLYTNGSTNKATANTPW